MISETQPKFIYLSSCHLFDGNRGNYHETDVVLPALVMGKVKLGGENFIRGKSVNYNIVRLSPIFGRGNGVRLSFMDMLRMKLDRKQRIELSGNELYSFAPAPGAVEFITRLVDGGPKNKILHYGGLTKISYVEFARKFATRFGYDPDLIVETKSKSSQILDYSLNSTYVTQNLKIQPLLLEEGFDLIEKQLVPGA
jgi:dTDP-4-dehydrorhamnose reductase